MNYINIISICVLFLSFQRMTRLHANSERITPHKYTTQKTKNGFPAYSIPAAERYTLQAHDAQRGEIVYYLSKPTNAASYPIIILCGGSSQKKKMESIIHFHRYFLQELHDLNLGVLTIEQQGIDGDEIDIQEFWHSYTRSNRLHDHHEVIDNLIHNPPIGWDHTLVFLGVSEGGPIATKLSETHGAITRATILWSGAGDDGWTEELWLFIRHMLDNSPWWLRLWHKLPHCFPFSLGIPKTKQAFQQKMENMVQNPTPHKEFLGMTYHYHADAMEFPAYNYADLTAPILVVTGAQDSIIASSDHFVAKAEQAGADITYMRIEDMDHYIRKRPEIIEASFVWLKKHLPLTVPVANQA